MTEEPHVLPNTSVLDVSGKCLNSLGLLDKKRFNDRKIKTVILDDNTLTSLHDISIFGTAVEQISASGNKIVNISNLDTFRHLTVLNLPSNNINSIHGLSNLSKLTWLSLSGNSIRVVEHAAFASNRHLKHIDLSDNTIKKLPNFSQLTILKTLLLHGNILTDLSDAPLCLPVSLCILSLAENEIIDLNQVSYLNGLPKLEQLSMMNNPCVLPGPNTMAFDYRPFVTNMCLRLKVLDGQLVSDKESLKAEWLFSQGRGRQFTPGQHYELVQYLATVFPKQPANVTQPGVEVDDEKLRRVLNKQRLYQQQQQQQQNIESIASSVNGVSPPPKRCQSPLSPLIHKLADSPGRNRDVIQDIASFEVGPAQQLPLEIHQRLQQQHTASPHDSLNAFTAPNVDQSNASYSNAVSHQNHSSVPSKTSTFAQVFAASKPKHAAFYTAQPVVSSLSDSSLLPLASKQNLIEPAPIIIHKKKPPDFHEDNLSSAWLPPRTEPGFAVEGDGSSLKENFPYYSGSGLRDSPSKDLSVTPESGRRDVSPYSLYDSRPVRPLDPKLLVNGGVSETTDSVVNSPLKPSKPLPADRKRSSDKTAIPISRFSPTKSPQQCSPQNRNKSAKRAYRRSTKVSGDSRQKNEPQTSTQYRTFRSNKQISSNSKRALPTPVPSSSSPTKVVQRSGKMSAEHVQPVKARASGTYTVLAGRTPNEHNLAKVHPINTPNATEQPTCTAMTACVDTLSSQDFTATSALSSRNVAIQQFLVNDNGAILKPDQPSGVNTDSEADLSKTHFTSNQVLNNDTKQQSAAIRIQALWRGFRVRNLDNRVREIYKEIRLRRSEALIVHLSAEVARLHRLHQEEKKLRGLQLEAIQFMWRQIQTLTNSAPSLPYPDQTGLQATASISSSSENNLPNNDSQSTSIDSSRVSLETDTQTGLNTNMNNSAFISTFSPNTSEHVGTGLTSDREADRKENHDDEASVGDVHVAREEEVLSQENRNSEKPVSDIDVRDEQETDRNENHKDEKPGDDRLKEFETDDPKIELVPEEDKPETVNLKEKEIENNKPEFETDNLTVGLITEDNEQETVNLEENELENRKVSRGITETKNDIVEAKHIEEDEEDIDIETISVSTPLPEYENRSPERYSPNPVLKEDTEPIQRSNDAADNGRSQHSASSDLAVSDELSDEHDKTLDDSSLVSGSVTSKWAFPALSYSKDQSPLQTKARRHSCSEEPNLNRNDQYSDSDNSTQFSDKLNYKLNRSFPTLYMTPAPLKNKANPSTNETSAGLDIKPLPPVDVHSSPEHSEIELERRHSNELLEHSTSLMSPPSMYLSCVGDDAGDHGGHSQSRSSEHAVVTTTTAAEMLSKLHDNLKSC